MNASDIMTEDPMTADADTTVRQAIEIIQTLEVRHLPVVDQGNQLIGMLSDRDMRGTGASFTALEGQLGGESKVTTVMNADVVAVHPETELSEMIDLMLENKVGALPVVNPTTNELLGIVSYVDLLRTLREAS